jgi:eukaryotic-like serine/threonine-protein kinase
MSELQNASSAGRRCPQCGSELPGDLAPELCPKCLLKTALATEPQIAPRGTIRISAEKLDPGLPQSGERLGHYRIVCSLGGGGMGKVYEAEDLDNGRRIALKVLNQALDSPEARRRFFREGRLAASINHPNSVYVFGTEELGGVPLITMELVAGGTLEDRVRSLGPMFSAQAVDAVLQIIAGLDVAQRIGILHRDVKPSNCFVDADGTVKIGDFGLSISTAIRAETSLTAAGSFLGTPAFCSPEQLRGEELNAKSDMYSVGATLFYLLTGHTPFQAKNVVALIATVLEQPAPSPRQFRPKLPRGLSKAVLRCLEKQPGERFRNYEELRKALLPYSSTAPVPATLGLRFLAGLIDTNFTWLFGFMISMVAARLRTHTPFTFFNFPDLLDAMTHEPKVLSLGIWVLWVFYYALLEGIWGVTLGRLACGLRVVGPDNNPPGFWRALPRPLIYLVATSVGEILAYGLNSAVLPSISSYLDWLNNLLALTDYVVLALLFSTMRRRNGFAAIHDLITKTRVVSKPSLQVRSASAVSESLPSAIEAKPLIGPYHVLNTIEESTNSALLLGYDLRLLRKVWIRTVPPGTPPVSAALRNLGRIGRLRWLAGRRSQEENWDAFEAASGRPLAQLLEEKKQSVSNLQPWAQVRYWLSDLATELSAAQKDGTIPPFLALDRVWITSDGRAKLLDFSAPGLPPSSAGVFSPPPLRNAEGSRFLGEIAAAALEGRVDAAAKLPGEVSVPLPMYVRRFFDGLAHLADMDAFLLALRPLLQRTPIVTRRRRAAIVAGCLVLPLLVAFVVFFIGMIFKQWDRHNPGISELAQFLEYRSAMRLLDSTNVAVPTDPQFATYIATHYRATITNNASWSNALTLLMIQDDDRRFAYESVTQHPAPSDNEIGEANAALIKSHDSWMISSGDVKDSSFFVDRLRRQSDPVSAFLWHSLSQQDRAVLTNYQASAAGSNQVLQILNIIVCEPCIYNVERFKGVTLRPDTIWLMKQTATNTNLSNINGYFVNRFLLEDAYPQELSRIQFSPNFPGLFSVYTEPVFQLMVLPITLCLLVCLPALIAALAFRGGLILLVSGVTFVRHDGAPASRLRLLWRSFVSWSFFLAAVAIVAAPGAKISQFWVLLAVCLFCVLAVVSISLPQRGLQDRLAGTWPVPR